MEEILYSAHGNFEGQNKVLEPSVIIIIFIIKYCIINADYNYIFIINTCRSQWPRGLRRRSAALRLLRSWVRFSPRAWMFVVSVVSCQVDVSATSLSLVQRIPTYCDASLCVIK